MLHRATPEVGCWYEDAEQGRLFEVVSVDEVEASVAIQYFEGEIEALELESFVQLPLRIIQQPEDWGGPFELDPEDRYDSDAAQADADTDELRRYDGDDTLHIVDDV